MYLLFLVQTAVRQNNNILPVAPGCLQSSCQSAVRIMYSLNLVYSLPPNEMFQWQLTQTGPLSIDKCWLESPLNLTIYAPSISCLIKRENSIRTFIMTPGSSICQPKCCLMSRNGYPQQLKAYSTSFPSITCGSFHLPRMKNSLTPTPHREPTLCACFLL